MSMKTIELSSSLIKRFLTDIPMPQTWCSDFNTCLTPGFYAVKETTVNPPKGFVGTPYGCLMVICSNYFHVQIFFSTTQGAFFRLFTVSGSGAATFYYWRSFGVTS